MATSVVGLTVTSRPANYFEPNTASQERKRLISDTDLFRASWKIANGGKRYIFNGKSCNTYDSILASEFFFFNLGPPATTNYACNKIVESVSRNNVCYHYLKKWEKMHVSLLYKTFTAKLRLSYLFGPGK